MAEALAIVGLVSSIVQFVDYSSKVVERLSDFQSNLDEVPKTFKDIKTELPLLVNTLKRTEDQVRAGDVSQDTQDALFLVVEGCRDQLKILDDILFKTLPKVGDSSLKRGRKAFSSISQEKKVKQITTTLRNYIQSLTYHQATMGISKLVAQPSTTKTSCMASVDRNHIVIDQRKLLEEINRRFRGKLYTTHARISGIRSDLSQIHLRLDEFSNLHQNQMHQLPVQGRYLEGLREQIREPQLISDIANSISTPVQALSNETQTSDQLLNENIETSCHTKIARHLCVEQYSSLPRKDGRPMGYSAVRIRASRYRRSRCEGWCNCICHRPQYLRTPPIGDLLLGSLFLSYSGFSIQLQRCNQRNCNKQSIPTITISYQFPQWLLARMIHFVMSFTYHNGPQVSLKMPRIVPGSSDLFSFAVQGNFDGIKSLFTRGLASPYDVAATNGRTALHYAVTYNHQELSQFLIDSGADPNLEDKNNATTVTIAWDRIFGNLADQSTTESWQCMFDSEEYLESRTFPPLHQIVLNLTRIDLQQQLEMSTSTIDERDSDGRTALSWAAARGDAEATKLLLKFGANPNILSYKNQSPLHWGAQSTIGTCAEIFQALLDSGADVNCIDDWKRTALIYASADQDDPDTLKPLIHGRANLNPKDCYGRTPLGYAAKMKRTRTLKLLLSYGADPYIPDSFGFTPLFEAVQQNHHEILRLLLRHGIMPISKVMNGKSILHVASFYSDAETMRILATEEFGDLSIDNKDHNGLTPQDLYFQRGDISPELEDAFHTLIGSTIRASKASEQSDTGSISESGDNDDTEGFADALEYLDEKGY